MRVTMVSPKGGPTRRCPRLPLTFRNLLHLVHRLSSDPQDTTSGQQSCSVCWSEFTRQKRRVNGLAFSVIYSKPRLQQHYRIMSSSYSSVTRTVSEMAIVFRLQKQDLPCQTGKFTMFIYSLRSVINPPKDDIHNMDNAQVSW
ncbi:hypothetical protein JOB18_006597 [Solea senegalensis]|uniref:Uncharacterized protein n=1 Tax=Solea senegalensis TaxID=28829 RepID=A0AAV6PJQ5_SOLSE|nr:hypothetical protein JOB18_006597 [Solea senegalensis]